MRRSIAICAALVAVTGAAYAPLAWNDFVQYDDRTYIAENPPVLSGLTWNGLAWAFNVGYAANWHPLTWLSLMLDCQLFGPSPLAVHLHNLLLHAASTVLLYLVLVRMTRAAWPSAAVAALFALHPAHVESVAWAAERKDVLSTLFWMLTIFAYVRYAERGGAARYAAVLLLLALGLMAKPMLVTLPLVLLLLDYWPLGRLWAAREPAAPGAAATAPPASGRPTAAWRLVLEKVPLLALAAASSVMTILAQSRAGALMPLDAASAGVRIENALVAYAAYIGKMLWPADLALMYPYSKAVPAWQWVGAAVLLAGISALVAWAGRRRRYLAAGWLWYLVTLVPVIGLVQVGKQAMADRYTYISYIGLFIMLAWGAADLAAARRLAVALGSAAAAALLACAVLTAVQVRYWADSETLFRRALAVTGVNHIMEINLGLALAEQGRPDEAILHYRLAARLAPQLWEPHYNMALALQQQGKIDEAIAEYHQAILRRHDQPMVFSRLGKAHMAKRDFAQAAACFREAVRLAPDDPDAHNNLAAALLAQDNFGQAAAECLTALRLRPDYPEAHTNLANALARQGKTAEAETHFREALRLEPDNPEAYLNLGMILGGQGKFADAVSCLERALGLKPDFAKARCYLAKARDAQGDYGPAADHYRETLRLDPNYAPALAGLAWLRATCPDARFRNGDEAVGLAERASEKIGGKDLSSLDVLAAAYAEAGRFADAARVAEQACALASSQGQNELADAVAARLALYRAGRPYRHQPPK